MPNDSPSPPPIASPARESVLLDIIGRIATAANAANELEGPLEFALAELCRSTGWTSGHVYVVRPTEPDRLASTGIWYTADPAELPGLRKRTPLKPAPAGDSLPARVLAEGRPLWLNDVHAGVHGDRWAPEPPPGVRAAAAAPLMVGESVAGVLEFFGSDPAPADETLLDALRQVGVILGRVLERERARLALEESRESVRRLNEELERRVQERTSELARTVEELEAFAYSVSHDLRGPLRALDGFSQALLEDYGDVIEGEGRDYLKRIRRASQRMGTLMDDLLDLSRISRNDLRRAPVDLGDVARASLASLRELEPERDVELVVEPGLEVRADPNLIQVLMENLVGNAWKFTRSISGARIDVGRVEEEDGTTAFFVRDNGAGFDPAYADKLFAPFQRLHSETEYEGNGIGLATVQRIARRHGGRTWARGRLGEGATFFFTLDYPEGT